MNMVGLVNKTRRGIDMYKVFQKNHSCKFNLISGLSTRIFNEFRFPLSLDDYTMLQKAINTMRYSKGPFYDRTYGLAAPQIGCPRRFILVADPIAEKPFDSLKVCLNPKLMSQSNETEVIEEGCVSIPS